MLPIDCWVTVSDITSYMIFPETGLTHKVYATRNIKLTTAWLEYMLRAAFGCLSIFPKVPGREADTSWYYPQKFLLHVYFLDLTLFLHLLRFVLVL